MRSLLRDEILKTSDVIVVKVGTNVLTHANGLLNEERIAQLTDDLSRMIIQKKRVVLVSSGAIAAGLGRLGRKERPTELSEVQAVAAVGQCTLINTYERFFEKHHILAAQVLLTAEDLSNRKRYLNARNTIQSLLDFGVLPIINENDTVSVDELHTTFGDNDRLASLVANQFETPLLILLTDVDGLYNGDPNDPKTQLIPIVENWSSDLMKLAAAKHSKRSKGGMLSKLKAVKMITGSGGNVIIANGDRHETLREIFDAKETGTIFLTQSGFLTARKRWLGFAVHTEGRLILDDGAIYAIRKKGKSLLPIGIVNAEGNFEKGSIVSLFDQAGKEIARGLTNYGLKDILLIRGKKTAEIKTILGQIVHCDVINRDNLQLID
jgi:glutamate 5-kinase